MHSSQAVCRAGTKISVSKPPLFALLVAFIHAKIVYASWSTMLQTLMTLLQNNS